MKENVYRYSSPRRQCNATGNVTNMVYDSPRQGSRGIVQLPALRPVAVVPRFVLTWTNSRGESGSQSVKVVRP